MSNSKSIIQLKMEKNKENILSFFNEKLNFIRSASLERFIMNASIKSIFIL